MSSSSTSNASKKTLSFFPTPALDHAAAGIGAGTVAVLCMHPLDLLKVKFQVATTPPVGGAGKQIYNSLRNIWDTRGLRGLYRGVNANIAGNASSWGLYFWFYTMLKKHRIQDRASSEMSPQDYLIASAQASAVTALLTNPIWVVKVRMFTTNPESPKAYKGLYDGLKTLYRTEGFRGWWKGTSLALFGVTNGALQFMLYEEMKKLGFARKKKMMESQGLPFSPEVDKLSNFSYTLISGGSKLLALSATYPYQVVRSRIQNDATAHIYPNLRTCIKRTWLDEGARGFYRGLGINLVRVLPGTCVTLVVYENIAWLLRTQAAKREQHD